MLTKIISISNVGRFRSYSHQGNREFRKLTLIYAGNGHGKTTLCDILRSVHSGDGRYISGREALGSSGGAAVKLGINDQIQTFTNGAWDVRAGTFLIYDSTFVNANVYSGEYVTHNHKKQLYNVIIGDTGVKLALAVADLDPKLREASRELTTKTASVEKLAPAGMTAKAFQAIEHEEDLAAKIQSRTDELTALHNAAAINAKPYLRELAVPAFPSDYVGLITATFQGISEDVE